MLLSLSLSLAFTHAHEASLVADVKQDLDALFTNITESVEREFRAASAELDEDWHKLNGYIVHTKSRSEQVHTIGNQAYVSNKFLEKIDHELQANDKDNKNPEIKKARQAIADAKKALRETGKQANKAETTMMQCIQRCQGFIEKDKTKLDELMQKAKQKGEDATNQAYATLEKIRHKKD